MAWNGGVFTRLKNWVLAKDRQQPISSYDMDLDTDDIVAGLNQCITKDSSNAPNADFNFNGNKGKNLEAGENLNDAINLKQLMTKGNLFYVDNSDSDDVNIINLNILPLDQSMLQNGMHVCIRVKNTNTSDDVSIRFDAQNSVPVRDCNHDRISIGSIQAGSTREFIYNYRAGEQVERTFLLMNEDFIMDSDLDFKGHKGINVAAGTGLQDIVNINQLKQSGNYYTSTQININSISINIAPLENLNYGFHCFIHMPTTNTGNVTITPTTTNGNLSSVRVLNVKGQQIAAGLITANSVREFMYVLYNNTPTFVLINPEVIIPNNFALTNFSNVASNIKYVNYSHTKNNTTNDYNVTGIRFNNNICIQSGLHNLHSGDTFDIYLPITMSNKNYYANIDVLAETEAEAKVIRDNNVRAIGIPNTNGILSCKVFPPGWSAIISQYIIISWSVSGIAGS